MVSADRNQWRQSFIFTKNLLKYNICLSLFCTVLLVLVQYFLWYHKQQTLKRYFSCSFFHVITLICYISLSLEPSELLLPLNMYLLNSCFMKRVTFYSAIYNGALFRNLGLLIPCDDWWRDLVCINKTRCQDKVLKNIWMSHWITILIYNVY